MFFALMGGIILNLMPCVFPVLSMVSGTELAKNIGESQTRQRMDGIVYTLGVISAFIVLASVLILLRAGARLLVGRFSLQPWFLAFIVYVFFLMALSLSSLKLVPA